MPPSARCARNRSRTLYTVERANVTDRAEQALDDIVPPVERERRHVPVKDLIGRQLLARDSHERQIEIEPADYEAVLLTEGGLIDEYRLYLRPVVLGGGTPFFRGARPPLRLVASDLIVDDLIRLTYVPA